MSRARSPTCGGLRFANVCAKSAAEQLVDGETPMQCLGLLAVGKLAYFLTHHSILCKPIRTCVSWSAQPSYIRPQRDLADDGMFSGRY